MVVPERDERRGGGPSSGILSGGFKNRLPAPPKLVWLHAATGHPCLRRRTPLIQLPLEPELESIDRNWLCSVAVVGSLYNRPVLSSLKTKRTVIGVGEQTQKRAKGEPHTACLSFANPEKRASDCGMHVVEAPKAPTLRDAMVRARDGQPHSRRVGRAPIRKEAPPWPQLRRARELPSSGPYRTHVQGNQTQSPASRYASVGRAS